MPPDTTEGSGTCYLTCKGTADCPAPASNSTWTCGQLPNGNEGEWYCQLALKPFCGDKVIERGEECDDGNYQDGDGCTADCQTEVGCGNGYLDVDTDANGLSWTEECDDDNVVDGDGCSSTCHLEGNQPVCGNGVVEMGETCDPKAPRWLDGGCTADCQREDGCGNGTTEGDEQCDDGNAVSGDGCDQDCHLEFVCGNNVCEAGNHETCEMCPSDCCSACGDGILDEVGGETCDDGNNVSGDGCSRGCHDEDGTATCGNGIWEAGEECEDGNTNAQDGCAPDCTLEFVCGDGQCDSDNYETCRLCPQDCCPHCGDNVRDRQYGEVCDSDDLAGLTCQDFCYDGGTLGCTDWCEVDVSQCTGTGPVCGNGTAECAEECDGTDLRAKSCATLGYAEGTLTCDEQCHLDQSDCSGLLWFLHEDFEGASVNNWELSGDWSVGIPSGNSDEPDAAHGGQACAGTNVGGQYSNDDDWDTCALVSPAVDLSGATAPILQFYQFVFTETGWDGGNVWVSTDNGVTWTYLDNSLMTPSYYDSDVGSHGAYSGHYDTDGWTRVLADLSAYAGQSIRIRFSFYSDFSGNSYPGWYIDDVIVTEPSALPVQFDTNTNLGIAFVDQAFTRTLNASGGSGTYTWSIVSNTNGAWLSIDANSGILQGTPTATDQGPVTVTVQATDAAISTNAVQATFSLQVMQALAVEHFDAASQPSDWTLSGQWQWGTPSSVGPSSCFDGTAGCVGVVMNGNYADNDDYDTCTLVSPTFDLTNATGPVMTFQQYIHTEGCCDGGNVWVSTNDGANWTLIGNSDIEPDYYAASIDGQAAYSGDHSTEGWQPVTVDLSAYAGQSIKVRFSFRSDSSVEYPGWYIDEVAILD